MALNFDAASNSGYKTASGSYNWSHTCTGTERCLVVGVAMLSVAGSSVSGITYNGVALTRIGFVASVSGAIRSELWRLIAPATGAHSIAVTLSASLDSAACASSFTGVNQTTPTEAANTASATNVGAADATVDVTTLTDNDLVIDMVATSDTAITVGSGQTQRGNVTGTLGSGAMSTEAKASHGAVTMSWTAVGALATWSTVSCGLIAATVPDAPSHSLTPGNQSLTDVVVDGADGGSAITLRRSYLTFPSGGLLTPGFAFEAIADGDSTTWGDASGTFNAIQSDATLIAAPVGVGSIPGNSVAGSQALIADLSQPWWISCWRTISAGTIDGDEEVFEISLTMADGHSIGLFAYASAIEDGGDISIAGNGISVQWTPVAGESLFAVRLFLSGMTLMGQVNVNGVDVGTAQAVTLGTGGSEGCSFLNGNAGSGDTPLLYSIWGKAGAITAATLLKIYNAGSPRTYAHRNVVGQSATTSIPFTTDANGVTLVNGQLYKTKVTAENSVGESALSAEASGTPVAPGPSFTQVRRSREFFLARP